MSNKRIKMRISDEAVEAAGRAVFEQVDVIQTPEYAAEIARIALEAAAPHMLGDAWDAGGEAAIEREHTYGAEEKAKFSNPYRSQA
jgi:hypothetical protein